MADMRGDGSRPSGWGAHRIFETRFKSSERIPSAGRRAVPSASTIHHWIIGYKSQEPNHFRVFSVFRGGKFPISFRQDNMRSCSYNPVHPVYPVKKKSKLTLSWQKFLDLGHDIFGINPELAENSFVIAGFSETIWESEPHKFAWRLVR